MNIRKRLEKLEKRIDELEEDFYEEDNEEIANLKDAEHHISELDAARVERDAALAEVAKLKEFMATTRDQFAEWKRRGDEAETSLLEVNKKIANLERARDEAFEAGKAAVFQECHQLRERLVALESAVHAARTEVAKWKERAEEWETEARGGPCAARDGWEDKPKEIPIMFCAICGNAITGEYHFATDMNGARRYLKHKDCRADQEGSKLDAGINRVTFVKKATQHDLTGNVAPAFCSVCHKQIEGFGLFVEQEGWYHHGCHPVPVKEAVQ
jgi:hypothetical protein